MKTLAFFLIALIVLAALLLSISGHRHQYHQHEHHYQYPEYLQPASLLPCSAPEPTLAPTREDILIVAGGHYGLPVYGKPLAFLTASAQEHAEEVARGVTPHQTFHARAKLYWAKTGTYCEMSEIVARTLDPSTIEAGAAEAWRDWMRSPQHWRTANGKPEYYGAGMAQDSQGRWIAVIVATWAEPRN